MLVRRKVFFAVALMAGCDRGIQGHEEGASAGPLAEALTGRVGLIVGTMRVDADTFGDDFIMDTLTFEGFFARHRGISATATLDALDARAVADVLSRRPGECWRDDRRVPERGEIQLFESGALSVEGKTSVRLEPKSVPPLLDRISGTLYRTGREVAIGADREVRIQSSGGSAVGAIDVRVGVPRALGLITIRSIRATGEQDLIVGWTKESAGDLVSITVQTGASTLRCLSADEEMFLVTAEQLGGVAVKVGLITATRVRLSTFSTTGLQAGYAAVLVHEEINRRRGK